MKESVITKNGKLRKKYMPAMYFDTSVLVEYWLAEKVEIPLSACTPEAAEDVAEDEDPLSTVARTIVNSERSVEKIVQIRKKIIAGENKTTCIVSPFCLIELIEWYAQTVFKDTVADATGTSFIQRKSKKQIGEYLKKVLAWHREEVTAKKGEREHISSGLEQLVSSTFLNPSFAISHGLAGLVIAEITNLSIPVRKVWRELMGHAYLQIGLSDMMHILAAKHLGCHYIASFDSDFKRLFDCYGEPIGMVLLNDPDEILNAL